MLVRGRGRLRKLQMEEEEEKDTQVGKPGKEEELLAPLSWPKLNYCKIAVNCKCRCALPSKLKKLLRKNLNPVPNAAEIIAAQAIAAIARMGWKVGPLSALHTGCFSVTL